MLYNCCSGKIRLNMKEVSESHVIVARLHVMLAIDDHHGATTSARLRRVFRSTSSHHRRSSIASIKCRESKYLIGIFGSVKCSSSNRDNKLVNRDQSGRKRKRTQRRTFSSVLDKACDENTRPSVLLHMEGSFRSYNEVNC